MSMLVGWGPDDDSSFVRPLGGIDVQRRSQPDRLIRRWVGKG